MFCFGPLILIIVSKPGSDKPKIITENTIQNQISKVLQSVRKFSNIQEIKEINRSGENNECILNQRE